MRRVTSVARRYHTVTIAVIVGMKSEAALLPSSLAVACAGGIPARAEALAREMVSKGATALVSFGIAGGLDPSLHPGDMIIASGVETEGRILAADEDWRYRLVGRYAGARSGLVVGATEVAASVAGKARLFAARGALAVDMESGAVAKVAAETGLPLAVIRAVADPAHRTLPASALAGLDPQGNARPWAVMAGLLCRPGDLPGLIRVGLDSQRALSALGDLVQVVGPTLGF